MLIQKESIIISSVTEILHINVIQCQLILMKHLSSFLCGISHTLSRPEKFISLFFYLFVHEREVLVTWFLFAFNEP